MVTLTLRLPNGKRKYFRGETREEVEQKRDEFQKLIDKGFRLGDTCKVSDLANTWLADERVRVRDTTYIYLESLVRNTILPYLGTKKVTEVKPTMIKAMVRDLSQKYSRSSQRGIITTLRSIFDLAIEDELLPHNPVTKSITAIGPVAEEKEPLSDAQMVTLLEAAKGRCIYPFVLLGLNTGLRRGELLGLMWSDIDFKNGVLTVSRTVARSVDRRVGVLVDDLKTHSAYRSIPLSPAVLEELREMQRNSNSVFVVSLRKGGMMTLARADAEWGKLQKKLDFHVNPHLMRHTRITKWIEQGLSPKEVQYLAGHSSPNTTLSIYTHYRFEDCFEGMKNKIQALG